MSLQSTVASQSCVFSKKKYGNIGEVILSNVTEGPPKVGLKVISGHRKKISEGRSLQSSVEQM